MPDHRPAESSLPRVAQPAASEVLHRAANTGMKSIASAVGAASVGTGAAVTAALASACCVGPSLAPMMISLLGASGLIAVSTLRPYTVPLLLASALMLAFSFRRAYRAPCCAGSEGQVPVSRAQKAVRVATWIAASLWLASVVDSIYGFLRE